MKKPITVNEGIKYQQGNKRNSDQMQYDETMAKFDIA